MTRGAVLDKTCKTEVIGPSINDVNHFSGFQTPLSPRLLIFFSAGSSTSFSTKTQESNLHICTHLCFGTDKTRLFLVSMHKLSRYSSPHFAQVILGILMKTRSLRNSFFPDLRGFFSVFTMPKLVVDLRKRQNDLETIQQAVGTA